MGRLPPRRGHVASCSRSYQPSSGGSREAPSPSPCSMTMAAPVVKSCMPPLLRAWRPLQQREVGNGEAEAQTTVFLINSPPILWTGVRARYRPTMPLPQARVHRPYVDPGTVERFLPGDGPTHRYQIGLPHPRPGQFRARYHSRHSLECDRRRVAAAGPSVLGRSRKLELAPVRAMLDEMK